MVMVLMALTHVGRVGDSDAVVIGCSRLHRFREAFLVNRVPPFRWSNIVRSYLHSCTQCAQQRHVGSACVPFKPGKFWTPRSCCRKRGIPVTKVWKRSRSGTCTYNPKKQKPQMNGLSLRERGPKHHLSSLPCPCFLLDFASPNGLSQR